MKKILVVDDNEGYRNMLCTYLENEGYEVTEASDGNYAYALFSQSPYDAVLMDLYLPEKDGVHTIQKIKWEFPKSKIIAISGTARSDGMTSYILNRAADCGADLTYKKTDDIKILLEQLKTLIR